MGKIIDFLKDINELIGVDRRTNEDRFQDDLIKMSNECAESNKGHILWDGIYKTESKRKIRSV